MLILKNIMRSVKRSSSNVFFLGQVEHDKLPQFYKLAKVHILASWMETPGLSSLEAAVMKNEYSCNQKGGYGRLL